MSRGRGVTVLIADDEAVVRQLLASILELAPEEFTVVATAEDADSAVRLAGLHRPALALVDVSMPGGGGPAAAQGIRGISPETRIVAVSNFDDPATVRRMLDAGASGYMVKGTPVREMLDTLRATVRATRPGRDKPAGEPRRRISVLVLHSDPGQLDALDDLVTRTPALQLVGLAQTPFHALSIAARHSPDVILVDPAMNTTALEAELAEAAPRAALIRAPSDDSEGIVAAIVGTARGRGELAPALAVAALAHLRDPERTAVDHPPRRRFERLRATLALDRLDVALQPIVHLTGERVWGYEALARFPAHPSPSPDVWFGEAHRAGVGVELEMLAVRSALAHLPRIPSPAVLTINASPDTLASAGLEKALGLVDASRVVLELTEHAPVPDYDALRARLGRLRRLGCRIAVDDCGAGFASLRHVALVGPDFLKLDIVLCRDIHEPVRAALARALVGFAAETGSDVIAEGIENPADLEALIALGVRLGQGHLFSVPLTPAEILAG